MSLAVGCQVFDVIKKGHSHYEATSDDPRFVYRFRLRRPRFMVVVLQSSGQDLDPRIYLDRGNGFDEANVIALPHNGACIYLLKISPPYRLKRIRIDPSSAMQPFDYSAEWAFDEPKLCDAIVRARRLAPAAIVHEVHLDGTPEKRTRRNERKTISSHFASVVALAQHAAPPIEVRDTPFISFVVPVFNTPPRFLTDLLVSFQQQPAGTAELVLSDDGSSAKETVSWLTQHQATANVHVIRSATNRGIAPATNAAIEVARGEWIGLVDHDDALTIGAVQLLAQTVTDHPDCQFIYTDEVVTDRNLSPTGYFFKPAYDEVLLSGLNYINHLSCYRRKRLLALGGLRPGYDGSQDYDLLLRYLRDLKPDQIKHLPYPAYRWRRTPTAFSALFMDQATQSARRALAQRYSQGIADATIDIALTKTLHRVRFDQGRASWPRVSIVIPNRDSFSLISRTLSDLTTRTDYPDREIIVVDNGSVDPAVLELYAEYQGGPVPFRYDIEQAPFNFSRQINRGIALATGEFILLLNNDVEVIDSDWLREMVSCFTYEGTGIVGARLLYPNRRLQHVGVIVGLGGLAGHWFNGQRESYPGPMARLHVRQSLTVVTGACMLISRACLNDIGIFDEANFPIAYNDVDFCLRAVAEGFRVVWTPFATLIHHESASRGSDEKGENRRRFDRDQESLRRHHNTEKFDDRAFNPWYAQHAAEPTIRLLDHLPNAR